MAPDSSPSRFLVRPGAPFRVVCLPVICRVLLAGIVVLSAPPWAWASPEQEQAAPEFTAEQVEFFEQQVLPLLKNRCFKCHGAEERLRGALRLTTRAGVLQGGDQGAAVSLDKPADSLLLKAINYQGPKMPPSGQLPATEIETLTQWVKEGLPVSAEYLGRPEAKSEAPPQPSLEEARQYWAYRPVSDPTPPAVRESGWVRNPIDAFLLAPLEQAGIPHNPPADATALIRRLTYDLTGLPPTPAQIEQFVADSAGPDPEEAYQRLLTRLLDSPQYGERWGRHWLDLVRFAETHGYERDSAKPFAWRYRDYVIQAFNANKPYDQFLREQLAGDELDEVTTESMIATGYYRLGIWDDEPADRPLAKYDIFDGIVSTTGQVMLGMSIGCARCHDHKKDPLPARDYYSLLAYFRDISDMNVGNLRRVAYDVDQREQAALQTAHRRKEHEVYRRLQGLKADFARGLRETRGLDVLPAGADLTDLRYRFYRDTWDRLPDFDGLKFEEEGSLPAGYVTLAVASRAESIGIVYEGRLNVPEAGEYRFRAQATEGIRLLVDGQPVLERRGKGKHKGEAKVRLAAGSLPFRVEYFNTVAQPVLQLSWSGPQVPERSLSEAGTGVLVADSRTAGQEWLYTTQPPADGWQQPAFDPADWKKGAGGFGQNGTPGAVVRTEWKTADLWLRKTFAAPLRPARLALNLHHDEEADVYLNGQLIHRAAGFVTAYQQVVLPIETNALLKDQDNVLAVHCHQTGGGQYIDVGLVEAPADAVLDSLFTQFGATLLGDRAPEWTRLSQELAALREQKLPEPGIEVMCVEERGREPTHILLRGNPQAQGDKVEPHPPAVACGPAPVPIEDRPQRNSSGKRLALARWMTHPDNPLTPRVMVNRLWQHHFGRGIVPTPNEFGRLGEAPTHPELLDWLARRFVEGGWKIKEMHRLICSSNAYRLSSRGSPEGLARDAANNLFWRFNMRRLSAEEVRDSILAVSGDLQLKAGGPGVYPVIPPEVLAGQSVPGSGWGKSSPEEENRRSVYVHLKRSLIVPILSQYDLADTDSSCPQRYTTTVPTQALGMLNGAFTNQQAGRFAQRLRADHPDDLSAQIAGGIRLVSGRNPTAAEIARDRQFIERLVTEQQQTPDAALRTYCLVLLGGNEFIYLD